ncbi:TlyA family RNA methyltransferase [bacterium]|nr:TlyA family RNA methyltransferase [bacterium]
MKERLDQVLTDKGYFKTRNKARSAIISGEVKMNGLVIDKPSFLINENDNPIFEVQKMKYVSRGGFKLEKAILEFNIDLSNKVCLDAGASTGGFTDCMLQNGAKKVYCVDVGYNQLAKSILENPKIKSIEHVNIKNCAVEEIYSEGDEKADFVAMDLSFISVIKVIDNIINLAKEKFEAVILIKPQFEVEKSKIGKNGIVKDKKTHIKVLNDVIEDFKNKGLSIKGLTYSPIKGAKGNIEYLIFINNYGVFANINVENIVNKSHSEIT